MPLPRFHKLESERQQVILAAASAEFAAKGFAGASYNAIIRDAGLSKGAMYYYFADKADLCRTVLERMVAELGEAAGELGPFDDAESFWREIAAYAGRATARAFETPQLAELGRLVYGEGSSSEVLEPLVARAEQWCAGLLREGQRVGAVRDDLPLDFLATAIMGLLVHTDRYVATRIETLAPSEVERLGLVCIEMAQQLAAPPPTS